MADLESSFQKSLIDELRIIFPGAFITKLDPNYIQGTPDLLILWQDHWAVLECKKERKSKHHDEDDKES